MRTVSRAAVGVAASAASVAAVTAAVRALEPYAPVHSLGTLYVFAVLPVAVFLGLPYSLPVAVASGLVFNFFFLPPVHTLRLRHSEDWIALGVYVATAIVVSELAARMRRRAEEARQREREAALLAEVSALLLEHGDVQAQLPEISRGLGRVLGSERAWIELGSLRRPEPGESGHDLAVGERRVGRLFLDRDIRLGAHARTRLLPGIASILAVASDRERLGQKALAADALQRSDEIKTAVLRAVSHDLRSPLTAIRAAAEGMGNAAIDLTPEDTAELVETIRVEAQRLERLVRNLLDLSRLEAGAATAHPELWTIDGVVGRALDSLDADARRVHVTLPAELPPVAIDAVQVERALANLLENALRVSPTVEVAVESEPDEVVVRVADHGPGLAPDELERIFRPFERGRSARGGSGLGLAIARGFVEANGGRIWAAAGEGGGAVFAFALPAVREPEPAPA
jgi:two-component system sensor histidine kinase KdpD